MGFTNKFYNVCKKDQGEGSKPGLDEYRVGVSTDTPHWYIRDYLARVSSHYDISAVEVDGKIFFLYLDVCFVKLSKTFRNTPLK